tara:strand:- start:21097 stop:21858 length:762 start_codon:yes stop_codon:yes gene_type:complete
MKNLILKFLQKKNIFISRSNWKKFYFDRLGKEKLILSFNSILNRFMENKLPVIFDVGANQGQTIERFNKIFDSCKFHCFEPNNLAFEKLKKFENHNIILNNMALGEKAEEKKFFNYPKTSSSSFYSINSSSKIYKINKEYQTTMVKVGTIDQYCRNNKISKIDILKIDTQGYEKFVLLGSKEFISNRKITFIETEIQLGNQYNKEATSFYDIEKIIGSDYRLIALDNHGDTVGNTDFQLNALYVSRDFNLINK